MKSRTYFEHFVLFVAKKTFEAKRRESVPAVGSHLIVGTGAL